MTNRKHVNTADPAAQQILQKARESNIETAWDRFDAMQDACGFGSLGLCCRNCMLGPCRIDPFGEGPQKGVCGIGADAMVARNLCRMVVAGASSHSDHGAHILEALERVANGETDYFNINDKDKLISLAEQLGIKENGEDITVLTKALVKKVKEAFSNFDGESDWLNRTVPKPRMEKLRNLKVLPSGIDPAIRETMARTHMGMDADPINLILGCIKGSLADYLGTDVSTSMSDVLLGTPSLTYSYANMGVLEDEAVNIAVHGHNPLVSESIIHMAAKYNDKAKAAGASKGINVVGACCTGNEVLMRQGIPLATNVSSQELLILTGAVDSMVVDVQCIMPSLAHLCECYHTKLITTAATAKIPGATHHEFDPDNATSAAQKILETAIEAYKKRDPKRVNIPAEKKETLVGFSLEAVTALLQKVNKQNPLQPLIDKIVSGEIYGAVLFAGCNNYKVPQDSSLLAIAEKLVADDILVLATGCAAGAYAKSGLLSPQATEDICGEKLKGVLTLLGQVAGLDRPLPPVWHMGSCVDNSRATRLAFALADKLGVDTDMLPIVASAPEAMSEKAVAIGTWAMSLGFTTHLGVVPPVLGGQAVTKVLTQTSKDLLGSHFIVETDPHAAYQQIKETITAKRIALGLST